MGYDEVRWGTTGLPLETLYPYAANAAAEAAAAPAFAPAMAAALPAVDLRLRPFPADFPPPPEPFGRPRLRPDRPRPGLEVSCMETPGEGGAWARYHGNTLSADQ